MFASEIIDGSWSNAPYIAATLSGFKIILPFGLLYLSHGDLCKFNFIPFSTLSLKNAIFALFKDSASSLHIESQYVLPIFNNSIIFKGLRLLSLSILNSGILNSLFITWSNCDIDNKS